MNVRRVPLVAVALVGVLLPGAVVGQSATELERAGRHRDALTAYRTLLEGAPGNVSGLLGLERVLRRLDWLDTIAPYVRRAVAVAPSSDAIRELEFRVAAELGGGDSAQAAFARWVAALPTNDTPYRAWAFWLARAGQIASAQRVLAEGRARLGDARLSPLAAQLFMAAGNWLEAAWEWRGVVLADAAQLASAGAGLGQAPEPFHERILGLLMDDPAAPESHWLAADVLARWNRPEEGWTVLEAALPADRGRAAALLRAFADRVGRTPTVAAGRARGFALERLAELLEGPEADRERMAAAQAFADAGNLAAAQRLLDRARSDRPRRGADAAAHMAALIGVLADGGQLEEAERRFAQWEPRLSRDDVRLVREKLAWAWVGRGELEHARRALGQPTTVGAQVVAGWIALYGGDLAGARQAFRSAGPEGRSREERSERSAVLVLLERVQAERLPPLGAGWLALRQADTTGAISELRAAAAALGPTDGRADVLAFAGALAVAVGDARGAEALLLEALAADSAGPAAPGAEYQLAAAYLAGGRVGDAIRHLEHLILSRPESALVPRARRLLDQAREAIPRS